MEATHAFAGTPTASYSLSTADFNSFLLALTEVAIPKPNSALSSNREFAHAGPLPSLFTVYGVAGAEAPQIEEQPVAFAMNMRSPNNWVTNFA